MVHNLDLRRKVPFLQEDGPDVGLVAAVEPVDSEEEEAEEDNIDNRNNIIMQYFSETQLVVDLMMVEMVVADMVAVEVVGFWELQVDRITVSEAVCICERSDVCECGVTDVAHKTQRDWDNRNLYSYHYQIKWEMRQFRVENTNNNSQPHAVPKATHSAFRDVRTGHWA
ncbi:hypothetical protein NDU88_001974 [Pleurodeles waltl]|uniref:Uncharacterized protein n=1 Tax=Pleurodeles waltl TaxID=8319 RepID=A0AAV7S8X1_PLEWA|nr:hypothetical protein NDU88_001974 [Pleurodeles waltl]